jgi:hypothetical protein
MARLIKDIKQKRKKVLTEKVKDIKVKSYIRQGKSIKNIRKIHKIIPKKTKK